MFIPETLNGQESEPVTCKDGYFVKGFNVNVTTQTFSCESGRIFGDDIKQCGKSISI